VQTEFDFVLPRGYLDGAGQVHRAGRIRLATAQDETEVAQDPRVQANAAYLPIVLLSRVVTSLGELPEITCGVISGFFASDLAYLEDVYQRLNGTEEVVVDAVCPYCSRRIHIRVAPLN
jgi:hypothetical protein